MSPRPILHSLSVAAVMGPAVAFILTGHPWIGAAAGLLGLLVVAALAGHSIRLEEASAARAAAVAPPPSSPAAVDLRDTLTAEGGQARAELEITPGHFVITLEGQGIGFQSVVLLEGDRRLVLAVPKAALLPIVDVLAEDPSTRRPPPSRASAGHRRPGPRGPWRN